MLASMTLALLTVGLAACSSGTGGLAGAAGTTKPALPGVRVVGSTYQVPDPLPSAPPGTLIALTETGPDASVDAARRWVFLYHSTDVRGRDVPVSGQLVVPRGRPPAGGWPVVSWAHGTTGIADSCSPTRTNALGGYDHALLQGWLKAGYAVVRTDYAGLGTPGDHPYLIGV